MPTHIFDTFSTELIKWNKSINLIQKNTEKELLERHILDSLELKPYLNYETDRILDIGTGAGFPGLVLAIDGAQQVELIEPNNKKATFLNHIKNLYKLPVKIHQSRWQDLTTREISVVTSRAFAKLTDLLSIINFVSRETHKTKGLFLKGEKIQDEIQEARQVWSFDIEIFQNSLHNNGCIVQISGVKKK